VKPPAKETTGERESGAGDEPETEKQQRAAGRRDWEPKGVAEDGASAADGAARSPPPPAAPATPQQTANRAVLPPQGREG